MQGNLNSDDVASLGIEDPFTKELIETWSLLNFKKQLSNLGETPIWYNSLIRIDNKPIHYPAGIYFVNDLMEEDAQFLTFDTFKETFAIKSSLSTRAKEATLASYALLSTVSRRDMCHLEYKT